jgi:hypothetical protein
VWVTIVGVLPFAVVIGVVLACAPLFAIGARTSLVVCGPGLPTARFSRGCEL